MLFFLLTIYLIYIFQQTHICTSISVRPPNADLNTENQTRP